MDGRPATHRLVPTLVALFVLSLALRPQLVAIGPLLPDVQADLGLSAAAAGLLGTIPVLCMGLFAPLGQSVAARWGARWAVAACLVALGGLALLRAIAWSVPLLLAATLGIGLVVGIAGAIPPIVIRWRVSSAPGLASGVYAAGIFAGSAAAAAAAVPLAVSLGSWREALGVLALVATVPAILWLVLLHPDPATGTSASRPRLPWRSRTAWLLVTVFGLQSVIYFSLIAWLPSMYIERGWPHQEAANLVAIITGVGLLATLSVVVAADRLGSRRVQLVAVTSSILAGVVGVAALPDLGVAWAIVLGLGLGAVFPLAMTLPVDVAGDPDDVGPAAALMLLGGYLLSATGPVTLGALRDLTGSFEASLVLLVVAAALLIGASLQLSPQRLGLGVRPPPGPRGA